MVSDYNIDIDLKEKSSLPTILKFNQYDRGVYIKVNLFDSGEPYIIQSTETAIVEFSLPGGKGYIISGDSIKDISNNSFKFAVDRNISLNSGEASFNVALVDKKTGTTTRKGSFKKYIKIESNSIDEGTVSSDLAVSVIETIQNNVAIATAKETSLREAITTGDLDNYVTKVSGKGLSSNDFTNAYKTALDGLTTTINNAVLEGKKSLYPVGSLYFNIAKDTNPGTLLGFGTWERIAQGRTLVGVDTTDTDFNTAGKTGGSKTHTMTVSEMPAHSHAQKISANFDDGEFSGRCDYDLDSGHMKEFGQGITTETAGGGQAFNIMPPYITVYIWERTA